MKMRITEKFSRRATAAALTVLLLLSLIPVSGGPLLETAVESAGVESINASAREYIRDQREQALKGFLVLSVLKAGLAVLRSSEIGLILNVRIGDLAVAVYDYVDLAWKVLLTAVAWFYLADFVMDLAGKIDVWCLQAALLFFSVGAWLALTFPGKDTVKRAFQRTGATAGVLAAILYVALPLGLVGAGWVSAHITGTAIGDANRYLEDLESGMPSLSTNGKEDGSQPSRVRTGSVTVPFPYDGADPSRVVVSEEGEPGMLARIVAGAIPTERFRELVNYLEARSRALASVILRQTAAYIFNIVLLPLLMVVALYAGGRYVLSLVMPR